MNWNIKELVKKKKKKINYSMNDISEGIKHTHFVSCCDVKYFDTSKVNVTPKNEIKNVSLKK